MLRVAIAERWVKRWGKLAGVEKCHPHRFRHSSATALLAAGVDLKDVQKILGHKSITSTIIYTQLAVGHKAKAVTRLPWKLDG